MKEALAQAGAEFKGTAAKVLIEFVASTKRGLCAVTKRARGEATGDAEEGAD